MWSKKRNLPDEMSQRDQTEIFVFLKDFDKLKKYVLLFTFLNYAIDKA